MAVERCLLSCAVITISIVSPIFAWNPDIHRYESYDLERGPVVYEAYYPDNKEESRDDVQDKRYFNQQAVLEKTYQVPAQRLGYPENPVGFNNYANERRMFLRDLNDEDFVPRKNAQPLDIRELSSLARTAISRDLENWNTLEHYLDHVKYQDHRPAVDSSYGFQQSTRGIEPSFSATSRQEPDLKGKLYEEVREAPSGSLHQIRFDDRGGPTKALRVRDLTDRDHSLQRIVPKETGLQETRSIRDPYPTENIFAPRPQVINYIFSRKPDAPKTNKVQSVSETKDTGEMMPRNYGDNLIRNEIKKTEEAKDVKVTSIEISEVPRHKTRHHHGEWPKRDYSRRQS